MSMSAGTPSKIRHGHGPVAKRASTAIINEYLIIRYFIDIDTDLIIHLSGDTHAYPIIN